MKVVCKCPQSFCWIGKSGKTWKNCGPGTSLFLQKVRECQETFFYYEIWKMSWLTIHDPGKTSPKMLKMVRQIELWPIYDRPRILGCEPIDAILVALRTTSTPSTGLHPHTLSVLNWLKFKVCAWNFFFRFLVGTVPWSCRLGL